MQNESVKNNTTMKKSLLTSLLLLLALLTAVAAPVDEQKARQIASDFMFGRHALTRGVNGNLTRAATGVTDGADAGVYLFNGQNGYVVVSANDELPAVLAYGKNAPYDAETAPPAMKALLEAYHYAAVSTNRTRAAVATHAAVAPLIETQWNQTKPYNMYCPDQSPTGCVATAVAQIMYYHRWPSTFAWDKMKTSYSASETGAAAQAVARLMADVGEKVFMSYASDGSSASDIDACEALRYQYGYAETTDWIKRECYTAAEWDETIYHELKEKRPVLYSAQSASSGQNIVGHAFVIDGYEAKDQVGYFHVNWGWGGQSDDYFLISVLNPQYQYTGGNAGSSGYSFQQSAVVGVQKAAGSLTTKGRLVSGPCYTAQEEYERASSNVDFVLNNFSYTFFNLVKPEVARDYEVGIGLYQGRDLKKILISYDAKTADKEKKPLAYGIGWGVKSTLSFGKDLADGIYQLRVISRLPGDPGWAWAVGSTCRYVELDIKGKKMKVTAHGRYDAESVSSFTVHSVNVEGSRKVGEPLKITINLTNLNNTNNPPVFLFGNASLEKGKDQFQLLTGGGTNLAPGETGDVVLEYTPQRAGDFTFWLSGSSVALIKLDETESQFSETITGLSLNFSLDVNGAKPLSSGWNEARGNSLKGTLHLTNYGSEDYNNKISIEVYGGSALDKIGYITKSDEVVSIAVGDKKDVSFDFQTTTPGNYYLLLFSAYDDKGVVPLNYELFEKDGKTYFSYTYNYLYLLLTDTAIRDVVRDVPDADVYDLHGVRIGKASDLKNLPKGLYIINKKKVIR